MDQLTVSDDRKDLKLNGAASEFRVRARFYAIRQVDGERAYDWYRRVRAAAAPCGFGAVHRQQWTPVVDKFVTGLRPGPVADRLLGERADGRLEDLLAAAVEAEMTAASELAVGTRRLIVGGGTARLPAGGVAPDLIAEIREGLKLYRYSGDESYGRCLTRGGGVDDANNEYKSSQIPNAKMIGHMKPTLDGKSWCNSKIEKNYDAPLTCKNCCSLATKLLENFDEKMSLYHPPSTNVNHEKRYGNNYNPSGYYHDDSKCYCSLPANDDRKVRTSDNTVVISKCLNCKKNGINKCSVCNLKYVFEKLFGYQNSTRKVWPPTEKKSLFDENYLTIFVSTAQNMIRLIVIQTGLHIILNDLRKDKRLFIPENSSMYRHG